MKYQVDLWFKSDLTPDVFKKEFKDLQAVAEAKSLSSESRGKKKLAYQIKSFTEGYFYRVNFESLPSKIEASKTFLTRSENVLRYLLTKVSAKDGSLTAQAGASGGKSKN